MGDLIRSTSAKKDIKWIKYFIAFVFGGMIAGLIMLGMILVGGAGPMNAIDTMKKGLVNMNGKMDIASDYTVFLYKMLKDKFPANQVEVTSRQVLGSIENVNKITARSNFLLNSVNPENVGKTIDNVNRVIDSITQDDITLIKTKVHNILDTADNLLKSISPETITGVLNTVSQIDTAKLNGAIETLANLHQIVLNLK